MFPRSPKTGIAVKIAGKNFPIKCVGDGRVVEVGYKKYGVGWYVLIEHANGVHTLYGHLKRAHLPIKNSLINKGDVIGYLGNSGKRTTKAHLHFELRKNIARESAIDPLEPEGAQCIASLIKPVSTIAKNDNYDSLFDQILRSRLFN